MTKPLFEHRHFTWLAHCRFMSAATRKPSNWRDEARNNIVPA